MNPPAPHTHTVDDCCVFEPCNEHESDYDPPPTHTHTVDDCCVFEPYCIEHESDYERVVCG